MAGGIGSRFWPASRTAKPKQFLDILGLGRTLIQMTYDRFAKFIPKENIYIVTNIDYVDIVKMQLPELSENQILGKNYIEIEKEIFGYLSGQHVIFYRILNEKEIEIIRFLHASMDLKNRIQE
jgi:plasmid stabilization system protein ParE